MSKISSWKKPIGRWQYIMAFVIWFWLTFAISQMSRTINTSLRPILVIVIIIALAGLFLFKIKRLHGMGVSGIFSLFMFVPGINILLELILFVWPNKEKNNKYVV